MNVEVQRAPRAWEREAGRVFEHPAFRRAMSDSLRKWISDAVQRGYDAGYRDGQEDRPGLPALLAGLVMGGAVVAFGFVVLS